MEETTKYYDDHYLKKEIQPIELMQDVLTHEEFIGFLKGNLIKYTERAGLKYNETIDKEMVKAKRYQDWLSQAKQGKRINPRL